MSAHLTTWGLWLAAAYLAGSIPFGLLIGWTRGVDLRQVGSGNVGATNAGRALGRKWGALCFVLDVAKGLAPVLLFGLLIYPELIAPAALPGDPGEPTGANVAATLLWLGVAVAAVLGHIFPVWLRFRGGKGVATGLGVMLGFWPMLTLPGLVAALIWVSVCKATGYVSLASVCAAIALPFMTAINAAMWGLPAGEIAVYTAVTAALALLVVVRHRSNLARLREGTEAKVAWAGKK